MKNAPAAALLGQWQRSRLLLAEDWENTPADVRRRLAAAPDQEGLLAGLVEHRLLTPYQADQLRAGVAFGLVLGNYRVLDRLGGPGGAFYHAEHMRLRTRVAVKVLSVAPGQPPTLLRRFFQDLRTAARLRHPNLAAVLDAGEETADSSGPVLHYVVSEHVEGIDLKERVARHGPFSPAETANLAHQIAGALAEAHGKDLLHGDLRPSKVRVTPEGDAVLTDFGLALPSQGRRPPAEGRDPYAAPEEADALVRDPRTDLYRLGAILFWCLTGRLPPAPDGSGNGVHPSLRSWCGDCPAGLEGVVVRLLAPRPEDRFPGAPALVRTLLTCLDDGPTPSANGPGPKDETAIRAAGRDPALLAPARLLAPTPSPRLLIVDDEPSIRLFCRYALQLEGLECDEASDGKQALAAFQRRPYDLVLLDIDMPVMNGLEVCRRLRNAPLDPHLKVIMFSGRASSDDLAQMLLTGADDCLTKPFTLVQLRSRVKAALRLKVAQQRSDLLNRRLLVVNAELEQHLSARDSDLIQARNALVLALAKLVEYRDTETGAHLLRLQTYSRRLAEAAAQQPAFAGQIDRNFIDMLACCAPLHDIGKVGLPDHILLKPAKLEPDERVVMQTHTVIGADTLKEVARQHGFALGFLQMAMDITRHHHERYDGNGYPDRLAGSDIPLSARLVSIADVYDALRSRRVYKPALSHAVTVELLLEGFGTQFDPALLEAFRECLGDFEQIYGRLAD